MMLSSHTPHARYAGALLGGFSWLRWFMLMALPYYVLLLLGGVVLWRTMPRAARPVAAVRPAEPLQRLRPDECWTILVLLMTTVLWLTDAWHGLTPAIPALLAASSSCCRVWGC
jgi:solute carrier family 13 (sodium-dependent dicarboxylate transporter), member 2/3/5